MSSDKETPLKAALARVGRDPIAKAAFLEALKDWEKRNAVSGEELRETTSGPIVDALFDEADIVTGAVQRPATATASGSFDFSLMYRSKVAREFAMADAPVEHVWEPQTTKLLLALAQRADSALIGGAYAGDHAVMMMHLMRERDGICHCFEPNREQSAMLEKNARAAGLSNYRLSNDGLWSTTAQLVMVGSDSHAHPEVYAGQEGDVFSAVSIDDYCSLNSIAALDIIMLDIEGGEIEALRGATACLSAPEGRAPDIVFEIHRSYVDWSNGLASTPICGLLLDQGYTLYAIRDYQGNVAMPGAPVEVVPIDTCYLEGPPHGFNIFASKHQDCVTRYGLRICNGVSPKLLKHRDPALHQPISG